VAQLGARFHGMEEVIGSIPIRSTNYFKHFEAPPFRDFCRIFVVNSKTIPRTGFATATFPSLEVNSTPSRWLMLTVALEEQVPLFPCPSTTYRSS
jgi:hypothetical protein